MTEAVLSIGLSVTAFACLAGVLQNEWDRTRCSVLAFESAHRRLTQNDQAQLPFLAGLGKRPGIRLKEDSIRVIAEASCGHAVERVELVKLEAAQW